MNILFVDIDGVFTSRVFNFKRCGERLAETFNPEAVSLFNEVVKETNSRVVVCSTWVHLDGPEVVVQKFKDRGIVDAFASPPTVEPNPNKSKSTRVSEWVAANAPDCRYFVIDDDQITGHPQVQTTWEHGFQKQHAKQVVRFFKKA